MIAITQPPSCSGCKDFVFTGACGGPEECDNEDPDVCDECNDFLVEGFVCNHLQFVDLFIGFRPPKH